MDPFSDSGELFTIQKAFYSGDFQKVLGIDLSQFSEGNQIKAQVLIARAKLALGNGKEVLQDLKKAREPGLAIIREFTSYITAGTAASNSSLKKIEALIQQHPNDATVEYIGGIVLVREGKYEEALELLLQHEGSLEVISLVVQTYLIQNHLDLALKEITSAKKWAQDNIVFNLAEAWVNLRTGGDDYQGAFYIYEELSSGGSVSVKSLIGQAVAQLQLGRIPEAEEALSEALLLDSENPEVLTNYISEAIIVGKSYDKYDKRLRELAPSHPSLIDVDSKSELFDNVTSKYAEQIKA